MDLIGLVDSITEATTYIDRGRKGFSIKGKAEEGRISYETGIDVAMAAFQQASNHRTPQGTRFAVFADPQAIILAEYTFLTQELEFCNETDKDSINSLTQAIQSFDDAFLALKVVEDGTLYKGAEQTYPQGTKYRVSGFPKDAYHIACIAHRTRLQNTLRAPGIDPIEKALLKQRFANLSMAQNSYIEKQKIALASI